MRVYLETLPCWLVGELVSCFLFGSIGLLLGDPSRMQCAVLMTVKWNRIVPCLHCCWLWWHHPHISYHHYSCKFWHQASSGPWYAMQLPMPFNSKALQLHEMNSLWGCYVISGKQNNCNIELCKIQFMKTPVVSIYIWDISFKYR